MVTADQVFSVPVFLVVFREALESVIIVSVLLAFLKQTLGQSDSDARVYKKLVRQVWLGTILGLVLCLAIGGAMIGVFYTVGVNKWDTTEFNYEGAFALVASLIISIIGVALLRIGKMQEKWRLKLAAALERVDDHTKNKTNSSTGVKLFFERYAMFMLPFVTVLREGIEAIVFVAGVTFSAPATSVPLAVVVGLAMGAACGYALYRGGSTARLQIFLVASTCLLYIVAAGLFSRAVWFFQQQKWQVRIGSDAASLGTGPGSYDITQSVWHVNCCSPWYQGGGGWGFLNAIFGWTNSATYGSVIAYNLYWAVIIACLITMRFREVHGRWPLTRAKNNTNKQEKAESDSASHEASSSPRDGLSVRGSEAKEVAVSARVKA